MSDESDPTPRSAAAIQDYLVREMHAGFRDVHTRIDQYRGEAQKSNAKLEEHITTCDKRYADLLRAHNSSQGQTGRVGKRSVADWVADRLREKAFDYVIALIVLSIIFCIYFALTHGAHLPSLG